MFKLAVLSAVAMLVCACGGGIKSYEDGVKAETKIMDEIVKVLESVDDEDSANAAASKIEELGKEFADLAQEIAKLPAPSQEELQRISRKQNAYTQEFQQKIVPQMMKFAKYPVLSDAWSKAMAEVQP